MWDGHSCPSHLNLMLMLMLILVLFSRKKTSLHGTELSCADVKLTFEHPPEGILENRSRLRIRISPSSHGPARPSLRSPPRPDR
jgi:hypothetical protein